MSIIEKYLCPVADQTDILACFEVEGNDISTNDATRLLTDAANGAGDTYSPTMTNSDVPFARPVCASYIKSNVIEVTLAIPYTCFVKGPLTHLLATINTALIDTNAKLVDLNMPKVALSHFDTTKTDISMLCSQLKNSQKPLYSNTNPYEKSAIIFSVIEGGKSQTEITN